MLQRTAGEVTNIADLENCWDGGKPSLINLGGDTAETVRPRTGPDTKFPVQLRFVSSRKEAFFGVS